MVILPIPMMLVLVWSMTVVVVVMEFVKIVVGGHLSIEVILFVLILRIRKAI